MEDVRLGRESASMVTPFTPNASLIVASGNVKRIRLVFSKSGTGTVNVVPSRLAATATALIGIQLTDANPTAVIRIEDFGDAVTDNWFAINGGAGESVTVFDVYLARDK